MTPARLVVDTWRANYPYEHRMPRAEFIGQAPPDRWSDCAAATETMFALDQPETRREL